MLRHRKCMQPPHRDAETQSSSPGAALSPVSSVLPPPSHPVLLRSQDWPQRCPWSLSSSVSLWDSLRAALEFPCRRVDAESGPSARLRCLTWFQAGRERPAALRPEVESAQLGPCWAPQIHACGEVKRTSMSTSPGLAQAHRLGLPHMLGARNMEVKYRHR